MEKEYTEEELRFINNIYKLKLKSEKDLKVFEKNAKEVIKEPK